MATLSVALLTAPVAIAQTTSASDSVFQHVTGHRLTVGGYGEIAYSRNFYSDSPFRYKSPSSYKDDPSHGRFDLPHAVIYLGYDFGRGWTFGTEIEFEHGGSGGAYEKEDEEGGEWEAETEKGGEVELEQFWIQKSFAPWANLRMGHIVVPVGLTNAHHEPLHFFTVYRPEGENTILPCTWHQTGVSLWGDLGDFRYDVQFTSGLDAYMFDRVNWIGKGTQDPYEFEVANKYGLSARIDNNSVKGLRLGVSGYFGQAMHNSYPHEAEGEGKKYDSAKGHVMLGSFDFTYDDHNWIARGSVDYGYVTDATKINNAKATQKTAPYRHSFFGSHAVATSVEAGYDVFSQIARLRASGQKLYVFGHFEYYDSYADSDNLNGYTMKKIFAAGVMYKPLPQIAIKAEYNYRKFKSGYNDEPAINVGVVYEGFFR